MGIGKKLTLCLKTSLSLFEHEGCLEGLRNVGKLGKKVTETEFEKYY